MPKVLIVDDEVSYRELLKNVFIEQGYDVRIASGSKDAMAIAPTFSPDVLIVDWMLSDEHDGSAVAACCRELNPALGVVFVSGYPNYRLQAAADVDAAFAWLSKPFHLDEVVSVVRSFCNYAARTDYH